MGSIAKNKNELSTGPALIGADRAGRDVKFLKAWSPGDYQS